MRKQTKLVAVTSAAALLAIGASMTSFAATGWVEEGGEWFFYDRDGVAVEDEWKKSGDNWYWLDSEESGAMAIDKLIEDGDNTYYVDTTGTMVNNTWVKVVNEEQDDEDPAEYNYYYMQSNGKAYKGGDKTSLKTIDGKRYAFTDDGKMLYGWVSGASDRITGDEGWAEKNEEARYFGSWDDGAMKTGWQRVYVTDDDEDKEHWFYFNSNGKRFFNDKDKNLKTKKINGKTYGFDERGVMVYEWNLASGNNASATNWSYFNSPEDGARTTKGWFKVIPPTDDTIFTAEVTEGFDADGADDENNNWYYADGDGNLYAGAVKKIKGKYYAFNAKGKMLNGLVLMKMGTDGDGAIAEVWDDGVDGDELDDLMNGDYEHDDYGNAEGSGATLYYFGNDADSDGSMKVGASTVNLDGDTHNFLFSKTGGVESRGEGLTGIDDNKYIYKYGKRLKAGTDDKYRVVTASGTITDENVTVELVDSKILRGDATPSVTANPDGEKVKGLTEFASGSYLINSTGSMVKSKTAAKDGDDWYFYVGKDNKYELDLYASSKNLKDTDYVAYK